MEFVAIVVVLGAVGGLVAFTSLSDEQLSLRAIASRTGRSVRAGAVEVGSQAIHGLRDGTRSTLAALRRGLEEARAHRASRRRTAQEQVPAGREPRWERSSPTAEDGWETRLLAIVELLLLIILTSVAVAGALAGAAWGVHRLVG
jgi:hypothetical protein